LYKNILHPIFSIKNKDEDKVRVQFMEYFLYRMSRIMAGHIEDKKWVLLEGLRNSGKGVLTLLLENAFERYVKITNSGNFVYKENTQDEAKKQSWMIDYQFVRLAFTQEITINKQSRTSNKVDGNMIKKFCSGGDSIEARKNHQDEYQFKIQA
jgi:phage/plasmid-associated DNA primase